MNPATAAEEVCSPHCSFSSSRHRPRGSHQRWPFRYQRLLLPLLGDGPTHAPALQAQACSHTGGLDQLAPCWMIAGW